MNERRLVDNPYRPGQGIPPEVLVGREHVLTTMSVAIAQARARVPSAPICLSGLRGMGKTVVLRHIEQQIGDAAFVLFTEASPDSGFRDTLRVSLESKLDQMAALGTKIRKTLTAAARIAPSITYELPLEQGGFRLALDNKETPEIQPLVDLIVNLNRALHDHNKCLVFAIDEVQTADAQTLRTIFRVAQQLASSKEPIVLLASGTPEARLVVGKAATYGERSNFLMVDLLNMADTKRALSEPAFRHGVTYTPEALDTLANATGGYPYFIQLFGSIAWTVANAPTINLEHVKKAIPLTESQLDNGFFRVRLDRLTNREINYVSALAAFGPGDHSVNDVAAAIGKSSHEASSLRNQLVKKGLIYSPRLGQIAFSVPFFDRFIARHQGEFKQSQTNPTPREPDALPHPATRPELPANARPEPSANTSTAKASEHKRRPRRS